MVRVEFARLRKKLETYYQHEGQSDAVRISLPKGSYFPEFHWRENGFSAAGQWRSSLAVLPLVHTGGNPEVVSGRSGNKSQRPILAAFKCADHSARSDSPDCLMWRTSLARFCQPGSLVISVP